MNYFLAIAVTLTCLGNSSLIAQQTKRSTNVEETADAILVRRVDSAMTSLQESIQQGDLFPEKFFGTVDIEGFKKNTSQARKFKWAIGQVTSEGNEVLLAELSKSNRDYIAEGRLESEALPYLKRQSRRYNALEKQLSGSKTAARKKQAAEIRDLHNKMSDADWRDYKKGFVKGLKNGLERSLKRNQLKSP